MNNKKENKSLFGVVKKNKSKNYKDNIVKIPKKKSYKFKKWYLYYKKQIHHLYTYFNILCDDEKIDIKDDNTSWDNFLYLLYTNSSKKFYPKYLYDDLKFLT